MIQFKNIKTGTHTTEVTLEDGTVANQFHLDFLSFDPESQSHHVMAAGTFSTLTDFQNTLERSRELSLCDDPAVFEDTEFCLKTSKGGYRVHFSYDAGLEERVKESRERWDARRAELDARRAASAAAREAGA